jgi:hypothetical protein
MEKTINEHDVLINVVELASEFAHSTMKNNWDYRDGEIYIEEDGETRYTETAQDIFNELYDTIYDSVIACKSTEQVVHPIFKNAITNVVYYLADEYSHILELLYSEHYDEEKQEPSFDEMSDEELHKFCKENNVDHIWTSYYELKSFLPSINS